MRGEGRRDVGMGQGEGPWGEECKDEDRKESFLVPISQQDN